MYIQRYKSLHKYNTRENPKDQRKHKRRDKNERTRKANDSTKHKNSTNIKRLD